MPERPFLSVVGARWVTWRRPDAAIFFMNKIFVAQLFPATVAPFLAHAFVQALGKSFSQTIREGFRHDGVVVVLFRSIRVAQFFQSNSAGDGERTDMVAESCFLWRDEVG